MRLQFPARHAKPEPSAAALEAFEGLTAVPMLVLALAIIPLLVVFSLSSCRLVGIDVRCARSAVPSESSSGPGRLSLALAHVLLPKCETMVLVDETGREALARTFDSAARLYHDARPRYPDRLFEDLIRLARLGPGASLLEIGCGTGIATLPLAQRAFRILCLERGPDLARRASANLSSHPQVTVIPSSFETWDPVGTFDLAYAATSWHWLDPRTRYSKVASMLGPGGSLAFFTARHAFPKDADPFFLDIQNVYEELEEGNPSEEWPPILPDEVPDDSQEITDSWIFEDVQVTRYLWEQRCTADQYFALLNTFSGHIAMQPEKRAHLYSKIRRLISQRRDPTIRRHWLAILHVARRVGL